jgi:hypothetical protein
MKTAVDAIFIDRDRHYNRRFAQMCGHYLVEPEACTPASVGRRGKSRTRSGLCANASSRRDYASRRWRT